MARIERDPLGEQAVPDDAYYGIQTARAVENFPISGLARPRELVTPRSRQESGGASQRRAGRLDARDRRAIVQAADEILAARSPISSSSTSTRPAPARRTT